MLEQQVKHLQTAFAFSSTMNNYINLKCTDRYYCEQSLWLRSLGPVLVSFIHFRALQWVSGSTFSCRWTCGALTDEPLRGQLDWLPLMMSCRNSSAQTLCHQYFINTTSCRGRTRVARKTDDGLRGRTRVGERRAEKQISQEILRREPDQWKAEKLISGKSPDGSLHQPVGYEAKSISWINQLMVVVCQYASRLYVPPSVRVFSQCRFSVEKMI